MKARSLVSLLALGVLLTCAGLVRAESITSELNGRLITLKGSTTVPYAVGNLAAAKYIALYFSAGWCPPCHVFTPALVGAYKQMKAKHPNFEIIFVSRDQSESAMQSYIRDMAMPWPAVSYSFAQSSASLNKYAGPGIPSLVVLDEKGQVLSDSYEGGQYVGPYKVVNDLNRLLSTEPAVAAATRTAQPAGPASKAPSGTNWEEASRKRP